MGTVYLAIIGDVVASRAAADRAQLQARLGAGLEAANTIFAAQLAAAFVLTVGDEFQGLLLSGREVSALLANLRAAVHPQEVRFGLGIGPLDTPLRPQALGMDGPCFHRARAAVERAERRGTALEVEAPVDQPALDIYSLLYSQLRRGWTAKQRQVVDLAMAGLNGRAMAARLGVSPSAVSQRLHAAGAPAVIRAARSWERAVASAMATLQRREGR